MHKRQNKNSINDKKIKDVFFTFSSALISKVGKKYCCKKHEAKR
jgi:hypothetical protein